jgi:hypothetical protein
VGCEAVDAIVIMRPGRLLPAAWTSIVIANGMISPADAPWARRNTIRMLMFQAAHANW